MIFGFAAATAHREHELVGFPGSRTMEEVQAVFPAHTCNPFNQARLGLRSYRVSNRGGKTFTLAGQGSLGSTDYIPAQEHRCCVPGVVWSQDPRNRRTGRPWTAPVGFQPASAAEDPRSYPMTWSCCLFSAIESAWQGFQYQNIVLG